MSCALTFKELQHPRISRLFTRGDAQFDSVASIFLYEGNLKVWKLPWLKPRVVLGVHTLPWCWRPTGDAPHSASSDFYLTLTVVLHMWLH